MFDRLSIAVAVAVLAIGAITFGYSLSTRPQDPAARACPPTLDEADAVDTFVAGLTPGERAWATSGGSPAEVRPGRIAVFATQPPDNDPGTVVLFDPATGARCRLIRLSSNHPVGEPVTSLEWSPSGDALALGLAGFVLPDGSGRENGVVLIWAADRLFRVWSGTGYPFLEWAPDGRSIAVWTGTGSGSQDPETRIMFADGSPDRLFEVHPWGDALSWSPDGTRWAIAQVVVDEEESPTAVSVIEVADGRATPIDIDIDHLDVTGWLDDKRLLLLEWAWGIGNLRYHDVPLDNPLAFTPLSVPGEVTALDAILSPDRSRIAYLRGGDVDGGDLMITGVLGDAEGQPLAIAPEHKVGPAGLAWSPDGSQLVFHSDRRGLWIVNSDGTGLRQIDGGTVSAVDDPWQPVPVR